MELGPGWRDPGQRIRQGAVVQELELVDSISCALAKVVCLDANPAVGDANRPEETTGRDARADVMPLVSLQDRRRIKLTLINIESDEAERPFVFAPVHADVHASHEPVVAIEQEGHRFFGFGIPSGTCAPHGRNPGSPLVVEDRARLDAWTEESVVAREESARYWYWISP